MANLPNVGKSLRWMAACAVLVGGFEGLSTTAYHDKLANGLPTVCYGETEGVHMGDHYSKQQCLDMLAKKLPRYWDEIDQHITVLLSDNEKIAYTSFAYNLGSGAFIRSSFLVKLNKGLHKEACNGMLGYDHTRSVGYVKGLDTRRHKEVKVCETIDREGPVQIIVPLAPQPHLEPCSVASTVNDRCLLSAPKKPSAPPKPALTCTQFLIWRTCK